MDLFPCTKMYITHRDTNITQKKRPAHLQHQQQTIWSLTTVLFLQGNKELIKITDIFLTVSRRTGI